MTGCLGLFSKPKKQPELVPIVLQGEVFGPENVALDNDNTTSTATTSRWENWLQSVADATGGPRVLAAPAVISGEVFLANVSVDIYKLQDYLTDPADAQPLLSDTTDADGKYVLADIPPNVDLVVVVNTSPRLTALVPATDRSTTADVSSATSLVAEAWAEVVDPQNTNLSDSDLDEAIASVRQRLHDMQLDPDDLENALDALIPTTFGEGMPAQPPADLASLVQTVASTTPGYTPPKYDVSGSVVLGDDSPLADVVIQVHPLGGTTQTGATTDAQGEFAIGDITGDATLEPVLAGYVFDPPTQAVSSEKHDITFVAEPVPTGTVIFADATVDEAVRSQLGLDADAPITLDEAATVQSISIVQGGVASLAGLEHVSNLEELYVYGDNPLLVDLSPLTDLNELTRVGLDNTSATNVTALGNKPQLYFLHIEGSLVDDVTPLATLSGLETLYLVDSPVDDVSALASLEYLQTLNVRETHITALPDMTAMTSLEIVTLRDNPQLADIQALRDTTATLVNLERTPGLDWCSWDDTWSVVTALEAENKQVRLNNRCEGPYTLFGTVDTESGSPYEPGVEVALDGPLGSWTAYTDANGRWEQTVEGTVSMQLRVKDDESTVWRFDPFSARNHMTRPYGDLNYTAYASDEPIIEGYVTDALGQPIGIDEVKLIPRSSGSEIIVSVDDTGYFVHELTSHGSYDVVPVADDDFEASVSMPISTPARVQLTPTVDENPLDVMLEVDDMYATGQIPVGGSRTFYVYHDDIEQATIEWDVDDGTLTEGHFVNTVEWEAPDTTGTVTITVQVTIEDQTATVQKQLAVVPPLTATIEVDRDWTDPGEQVLLTAMLEGYGADHARLNWYTDHGSIESAGADNASYWIAPNYGGTFDVRLSASVTGSSSSQVYVEVNVDPDPLCEGEENCGVIRTLDELQAMRENVTAHYLLDADIDATPTHEWSGGGFEPIGTEEEPFTGTFDGRNHVVDGLYMRKSSGHVGLFGVADGAVIQDVGVENVDVTGRRGQFGARAQATGALLGAGYGVTVQNAYSTGQVTADNTPVVGGLIGRMGNGGIIADSYSEADVMGMNAVSNVGGLVGPLEDGSTLRDSYSTGMVEGNSNVGGLAGSVQDVSIVERSWSSNTVVGRGSDVGGLIGLLGRGDESIVTDSYNTGDVEGQDENVGGLVGSITGGHIVASYNEGRVTGVGQHVGGLVGYVRDEQSFIENSWNAGDVEGEDRYVGGLVGANGGFTTQFLGGGTITESYSTGNITGDSFVGGLVGRHTQGGIIDSSWATGDVESTGGTVGGLVGQSADRFPEIIDSYSTGEVRGTANVGGLVGVHSRTSTIEHSYSRGDVYGTKHNVGGVVGMNTGTIRLSNSKNDVVGVDFVGGIAGKSEGEGLIEYSFSLGDVTGVEHVGGLVGREVTSPGQVGPSEEWLIHSYAMGAIRGERAVGGLVGMLGTEGLGTTGWVKYSYFAGTVSGYEDVGGLVGWPIRSDDLTEGSHFGIIAGGWDWDDEPTDPDDMMDPDMYEGWDFIGTWYIDNDYPDLIDNPRDGD